MSRGSVVGARIRSTPALFGAAVNASRYIALATHPDLQEASDHVDHAEEALDDTVAVDGPRVARVAAQRHAFELALQDDFSPVRLRCMELAEELAAREPPAS